MTAWQQLRGRAIRARRSWTNDCYRLITALIGSQMQSPLAQADMPDDVAETLALTRGDEQVGEVTLDARLQALLAEVAPEPVQARVEAQGISALTDQERSAIAIALMRQRNKVTHIFELVKAYGATSQVQYDRTERAWQRRENIAAKHAYEVAVNPFSGNKLAGDGHAPLVYAQDPRADLPAELQERLADAIDESDDRIVAGWLQYGGLSEPGAMYGE